MNTKQILRVILFLIAFATIFSGYSYWQEIKNPNSVQKVNVGVLLPLSGDTATFGFNVKRGIEFAKLESQATSVNLVFANSECDPEKAIVAFQELVEQNVVAIIGDMCSRSTIAITPLANQYEIPLISPSATSPQLSEIGGEYFFRTIPSDTAQGKFTAEKIFELGYRKLAIIHGNETYGEDLSQIVANIFSDAGGTITSNVPVVQGRVDVKTSVETALGTNPDAIYIVTNSPTTSTSLLTAITNIDPTIQIFGAEGLNDSTILQNANLEKINLLVTAVSLGSSTFNQRLLIEYDISNELYVAQAYDAFTAVYLALNSGAKTGNQIKEAISSLEFEGVSGKIKFDTNGDIQGNYQLYKAVENAFVELEK